MKSEELLELLSKFSEIKKQVKTVDENHVNLIDIIGANENAHSRILAGLFNTQHNGKYEILQSFIDRFFIDEHFNNKIPHEVKNPCITNEEHHIDLLVKDEDYAIIFENKVRDAKDQKHQIASYIRDVRRKHQYKDEQIFVVYLPSEEDHEPNNCSWTPYGEGTIYPQCKGCDGSKCDIELSDDRYKAGFKDRYFNVPYNPSIIDWLENDVLPECRLSDDLLVAALKQYIDFLKGEFNIRELTTDIRAMMRDKIAQHLGLDDNHANNFDRLYSLLEEYRKLSVSIKDYIDLEFEEAMNDLMRSLQEKYPGSTAKFEKLQKEWPCMWIEFELNYCPKKIRVFASINPYQKNLSYGVRPVVKEERDIVKEKTFEVAKTIDNFGPGNDWCYYHSTTINTLEKDMVKLIETLRKHEEEAIPATNETTDS